MEKNEMNPKIMTAGLNGKPLSPEEIAKNVITQSGEIYKLNQMDPAMNRPKIDALYEELVGTYKNMDIATQQAVITEIKKLEQTANQEKEKDEEIACSYGRQLLEIYSTKTLFNYIVDGIKEGTIKPVICAKSVAVDARQVKPEEVGQKYTVYSHGKVEKEITLAEDMMLLTTLDAKGNPVIDQNGNTNTYDMKLDKFLKTYPKQVKGGHFVKDPYAPGSVMVAVKVPDSVIGDGITMVPPCWGGYTGTLMPGGIVMFPFDPDFGLDSQAGMWKARVETEKYTGKRLDWYPNNEANTYSRCDKNGTFEDENLRNLFEQDKVYEATSYRYHEKENNGPEMGM